LNCAAMISLLGPPPEEFLRRSDKCRQYWDDQGKVLKQMLFFHIKFHTPSLIKIFWFWYRELEGSVPIPNQTFEFREQCIDREDRALFIQFMRRVLRWMPEERLTAEELAFDELLMGYVT
jgi:hypothetical protein